MNAPTKQLSLPDLNAVLAELEKGAQQTRTFASTLPPEAYSSAEFFELESERILRADWVCVGHASLVARVGDYFEIDVAGEPLMIVRANDGVKAISRACLHRWAPIASGQGNTKAFVCPFHKWVYDLDGQLMATPFMNEAEDFDVTKCRLPSFAVEVVEPLGLIFVNISGDAPPVAPRLADLVERYGRWDMASLVPSKEPSSVVMKFNWKIQIETFMECYHHIGVHPTTFESIQPARLSSCEGGWEGWAVCHSPYKDGADPSFSKPKLKRIAGLFEADDEVCDYINLFPNVLLAVRSDTVFLGIVLPTSADSCTFVMHQLVDPASKAEPGLIERAAEINKDFMALTMREDSEINELQQATLVSPSTAPGRLSPLETTVWDLANYVRERVLN